MTTTRETNITTELQQDVRERRRLLEEELEAHAVDVAVIASEPNVQYFSGFRSSVFQMRAAAPFFLLARRGKRYQAVVNAAEGEILSTAAVETDAIPYFDGILVDMGGYVEMDFMRAAVAALRDALPHESGRRIGFELGSNFLPELSPGAFAWLRESVKGELFDLAPIIRKLRRRKSAYEIERMRRSAQALSRAFETFADAISVGMTEKELHQTFLASAAGSGADWIGCVATLSADIERTVIGLPTDRVWKPGRLMSVDACLQVEGYWSDYGRTYVARSATAEQLAGYDRIAAAVRRGREAVRPGVTPEAVVEAIGQSLPQDSVFGRFGHGIGLDIVEPPSMHAADPTVFLPGMTVCVEPNGPFPGVGMLVSEETVAVTDDGCELLSPEFPDELRVIS